MGIDAREARVSFEHAPFSTSRAIKDLIAGKHPQDVFPRLGRKVTFADLQTFYDKKTEPDGIKDVVVTLKAIFSLDSANTLSQMPLQHVADDTQQHLLTTASQDDRVDLLSIAEGTVGAAIKAASNDTAQAIKKVMLSHDASPLFHAIFPRLTPILRANVGANREHAKRALGKEVGIGVFSVGGRFPTHFLSLIEGYKAHVSNGEDPTVAHFWRMVNESPGLLMHSTTLDTDYDSQFDEMLFGTTYPQYSPLSDIAVNVENLAARQRGEGVSIFLSPKGREELERNYREWFAHPRHESEGVNPYLISGCPAGVQVALPDRVYPNLIQTALTRVGKYLPVNSEQT